MSLFLANSSDPVSHIVDKPIAGLKFGDINIMLSMVTVIGTALVLVLLLMRAASGSKTGPASMGNRRYLPSSSFSGIIEVMVVYLRDEMLIPVMGARLTARYLSYLLSLFFFILLLNIVGLIPFVDVHYAVYQVTGAPFAGVTESNTAALFGGAATASISVTGALAMISFLVVQVQGFRELGIGGWLEHLCGGRELVRGSIFLWLVIPIIFVVELGGIFVKPAALAIRLFANMVAGHTLLLTLLGFGAMAAKAGLGTLSVSGITLVSGIGAILITFLEVFVALLQAFIFMFLTAVFISLMAHEEHAEGHEAHDDAASGHGDSHGHHAAAAHS